MSESVKDIYLNNHNSIIFMDKSMLIKYIWHNNILQAILDNETLFWWTEMTEAILFLS